MKKIIFIVAIALFSLMLISCEKSDDQLLKELLSQIDIPSEVTSDLDLKTEYEIAGKTITARWDTTASTVITKEGKITITASDKSVVLILTLTLNSSELSKQFNVTVKGNEDLQLLILLFQTRIKFDSYIISENLVLPNQYEIGGKVVNATWKSSNEDVLENNGTIHRKQKKNQVELEITLKLNQAEKSDKFTFTITEDPTFLPINWWHTVDVYKNEILGEANKPATPQCFPGAIYRKVVSSRDNWLGIEATVTLPEFIPDPRRFDESRLSYYLDNASVYLGGNAQYESDIGLTWSIGHENSQSTKISQSGIAFRPFWRYITTKESSNGTRQNIYKNANVSDYQYYYYPGDKVRMSVYSPEPGYLQMRIELLELTTIEKYVEQRNKYGLGDDFERIFSTPLFPSEGVGSSKTEFKRVNAIDQVNNEAKPTLNTNAISRNTIWHEVYLYRKIDDELYRVPLSEQRSAYMACPVGSNVNGNFSNTFKITYEGVNKADGGEVVTLSPNNGNGKLYNTNAYLPPKKEENL